MATYYTSKYSGEEIDEAADKVNDSQVGNDALKALIDALTSRVGALEGGSA